MKVIDIIYKVYCKKVVIMLKKNLIKFLTPVFFMFSFCIILSGCSSKNVLYKSTDPSTIKTTTSVTDVPAQTGTATLKSITYSDNSTTCIKITDIYKLNVVGKKPSAVAYKMQGFNQTVAYLGIWNDGELKMRFEYGTNEASAKGFETNTSLIDKRLNTYTDLTVDKVDINKLVIVYVKEGAFADSPENIIAYSKVVDMQHRVNNISEIQFGTDNIKATDIIASLVAVVKDKNGYKLISNTVNYEVVGGLPKEMMDAAIEEPKGSLPSVDIEKLFVAYMTFTDLNQINKSGDTYSVKLVTFSPVTGGNPVNMDEQGLGTK